MTAGPEVYSLPGRLFAFNRGLALDSVIIQLGIRRAAEIAAKQNESPA